MLQTLNYCYHLLTNYEIINKGYQKEASLGNHNINFEFLYSTFYVFYKFSDLTSISGIIIRKLMYVKS